MRAISADFDAILTATGGTQRRFRVQVKDSGGTFRDLSAYAGPDMVVGATWAENVDDNGHDCTVVVKRAIEALSLAPFMTASPANRAFAYPGTYAPLIDIAREVKVEWWIGADGTAPGTFVIGFHGYIDSHSPASGDGTLKFTARGQYALSLDAFVETERIYAYSVDADATKGMRMYVNGDAFAVGELVVPSEAKRNSHFYAVDSITTGVGGTEGAWPTGAASTVTFGGVTFKEKGPTTTVTGTAVETVIQQILNDNVTSAPTLTTAVSPSWNVRWFLQQRQAAWLGARALADQIGWDLRYKYNGGSADYRLELNDVPRAKVTPDRTFSKDQRFALSRLDTKLDNIRNVIRVVYLDSQDRDPQGNPKRKTVTVSDSTSISKYGRRFMEASEGKTSNIDSSAEATAFANAMLSDLKDPVAELEVDLPFFPFVELGDLYRFSADGIHFDTDQDLAVVAYSHQLRGGSKPKATTTLTCRGKPSGGYLRWLIQDSGRTEDAHNINTNNSDASTLSIDDVVGGTKLKVDATFSKHAFPKGFEFHVSESPGFTPDSNSLVQSGHLDEITMGNLVPGRTYYAQFVPFHYNAQKIVRGFPSVEQSFVAGRAYAGHIHEGIALGGYPLNGGFETRSDPAGIPDHWTLNTPADLGSSVIVKEDGNGLSGGRYLEINIAAWSGGVTSAKIPIANETSESNRYSGLYRLTCWVKNKTSNAAGNLLLLASAGYDYAGAATGGLSGFISLATDTKTNHWQRVESVYSISGSDVRSIALAFGSSYVSGQAVVSVDDFRIEYIGTPWYEIGDTTKFTDNYESIPGFQNSWVNYGGSVYSTAAFRKNQFGRVELRGIVKSGTVGAGIFVLPVGFRPLTNKNPYRAVESNNAFGIVEVLTAGSVVCQVGNNAHVCLDGISFETF